MVRRRSALTWVAVAAGVTGLLVTVERPAALTPDEIDLEAVRGDRQVALEWSAAPETSDTLFGGYGVWRSTTAGAASFQLLRHFPRRYPVGWTFQAGAPRQFYDPDSVVAYKKIEVTAQGDSAMVRDYVGVPPFNGFPYFYAVTWVSECLSLENDTVTVYKPQPQAVPTCVGEDCFFLAGGDTLEVDRVPCRRIDMRTNRPDTTRLHYVYQGTVESEEPLRNYAIETTRLETPVFPADATQTNLSTVAVVPNPYIGSAPWDRPGERKVQFVNLTERATVRIFTVGGDLVRVLEHPAPGSPPDQGSVDWDLKNADSRLVESGIYIFQVEIPGGVADFQGRLVIVR